ncbi:MAG: GntR family transcriptional regulator [Hyphomicrobiales bacterium]|nr:GntR family transcriptional regulator [Hyphomicrobiales bacterium]
MASIFNHQLRNPPLSDKARDRLRAAILEGELKPGDKINIERVAEAFGISRTPIREALKALETEGLVQIQANRGAIVEPLVWQEIHHRYRMRGLLEGYAAELSCAKQDKRLIAQMQENCDLVKKAIRSSKPLNMESARTVAHLNRSFHRMIWVGSGSLTLIRFLETLDLPQSFDDSFYKNESAREVVFKHHNRIMQAFVEGDAKRAGSLMEGHVQDAADLLASQADVHISNLCC